MHDVRYLAVAAKELEAIPAREQAAVRNAV
jgi:hypothetical protein